MGFDIFEYIEKCTEYIYRLGTDWYDNNYHIYIVSAFILVLAIIIWSWIFH